MRFTITRLGSAGGRTVGKVVADIVRYLEPRGPERPAPGQPAPAPAVASGDGPSSYYADRGTEPGRWVGHSSSEAGLVGPVDSADFARVLAGRDPKTGTRLLIASGSSGRRPTLGVGQHTACAVDGQLLYNVEDVAAALKVDRRDAETLIGAGERLAFHALAAGVAGHTPGPHPPGGSYLIPWIDPEGRRWITGTELDRCDDARSLGTDPRTVADAGAPDDQLSVSEAAMLAGVIPRYIRRLCQRGEADRASIDATLADGGTPKSDFIVAHRGTRDQWVILRRELVAFLERRVAPALRVGYDLTLTTEKSLGVLALLGDDTIRMYVLAAIEAGNDCGLDYFELHAASARAKGKTVLVRGLTIASFRHLTSRALDPFPHHHNVVANSVIDEHGSRRALDARGLYTHAQAASALATIEMRHQLTDTIGVRWRRGRSGSWEIDGIGDEVLREFSQRRNEIEEAVAELEAEIGRRTSLDEVQAVITGTRPAKRDVDAAALVDGWWARARGHGLTPEALQACLSPYLPSLTVEETELFEQLASPDTGVCASHSLFTRSDVLVAIADIEHHGQPLFVDADEAELLADAFLASDHVVQLDTSGLKGGLTRQALYATTEILAVQQRILERYQAGATAGAVVVPADVVDTALMSHAALTSEQELLVRSFCTSGQVIQCAIGRAGAGKTTTMSAAADAWRAAGYDVIGAAVKGEAARHLAAGAGIPTETVAWHLARVDRSPLHERTVLIIDEASTLSDRDLDALLHLADRTGATVRLIGDPDQHGAVTAGGMFRHLCEAHPDDTPELATTHRVRDEADRDAARLLRVGRTHDALTRLADAGHLHVADNDLELHLGMLRSWWDAHQAGSPHPMVDRRHYTRRVLNRLARQLRAANGELGDTEIIASGDRAFAVGDRVVARMAARHLHVDGDPTAYVRNGAAGTVVAVHSNNMPEREAIEVGFDDVGVITLPRAFLDEHDGPGRRRDVGIDHAYAVTSYAVQGATFDISTSRIDEGATRSEAYVDITRGRNANHLYLTRAPDPLDGEHLPKAPDPHLHDSVADRLHRSGPERAAIEFAVGPSTAAARFVAHRPPSRWASRFPEQANDPVYLRSRGRAALEAVLAYRSRRHPAPDQGDGWAWALGQVPLNPDARTEREAASEVLDLFARAMVTEALGADRAPHWTADQLMRALRSGVSRSDLRPLIEIDRALEHGYGSATTHAPSDSAGLAPVTDLLRQLPYSEWLARTGGPRLGLDDPTPQASPARGLQ